MSGGAVCAILAAGRSSRMGAAKAALRLGETTLLERALEAARGRRTALVLPPALAHRWAARENRLIVVNAAPERGMTRSLALADAALGEPASALVVLLVDTPLVDAALVERVVEARGDADVCYPVREGRPGHPVVFGPRPRAELAAWPEGDTLRALRADPRWRRVELAIEDDAPYLDLDTPSDLAQIELRLTAFHHG